MPPPTVASALPDPGRRELFVYAVKRGRRELRVFWIPRLPGARTVPCYLPDSSLLRVAHARSSTRITNITGILAMDTPQAFYSSGTGRRATFSCPEQLGDLLVSYIAVGMPTGWCCEHGAVLCMVCAPPGRFPAPR